MNLQRYIKLPISDGEHKFSFLLTKNSLYCPCYNPEVYSTGLQYRLSFYKFSNVGDPDYAKKPVCSFTINPDDFQACVPFKHEEDTYYQRYKLSGIPHRLNYMYVCFEVLNGDNSHHEYVSCQAAFIKDIKDFYIEAKLTESGIDLEWFGIDDLTKYLKKCYGRPESKVTISGEVVIMGENDIYWINTTPELKDNKVSFGWVAKDGNRDIDMPFRKHEQWTPDLKIIGYVKTTIETGGELIHVDVRSNPLYLSEDLYAKLIYWAHRGKWPAKIDTSDMEFKMPRIMNKTVQNVVTMTAQTDSKSNIIQPVFFRVRELASIVVHPEVTENICINLDAYKSQVNKFLIKIEGTVFSEIGRTESGIIFKVQGNMLPGKVGSGIYYILNQDAELVTSGKYMYEV